MKDKKIIIILVAILVLGILAFVANYKTIFNKSEEKKAVSETTESKVDLYEKLTIVDDSKKDEKGFVTYQGLKVKIDNLKITDLKVSYDILFEIEESDFKDSVVKADNYKIWKVGSAIYNKSNDLLGTDGENIYIDENSDKNYGYTAIVYNDITDGKKSFAKREVYGTSSKIDSEKSEDGTNILKVQIDTNKAFKNEDVNIRIYGIIPIVNDMQTYLNALTEGKLEDYAMLKYKDVEFRFKI